MKKILIITLVLSSFFPHSFAQNVKEADFNEGGSNGFTYCAISKYDKNNKQVPIKIYRNPGDSSPIKIIKNQPKGYLAIAKK